MLGALFIGVTLFLPKGIVGSITDFPWRRKPKKGDTEQMTTTTVGGTE